MIKVDLNVDLCKIQALTFPELKEYYEALFNIPTTSTRRNIMSGALPINCRKCVSVGWITKHAGC